MRRRIALLLALTALVLAGIRAGSVAQASGHGQAAGQAAGGPFLGMADPAAPCDQRFIDEMVMHHRGALMSSGMMIADSERPELRDLARRIQDGQQRQIDQMLAWRAQWYGSAETPNSAMCPMMGGGMMGGQGMGGMMGHGGMMGGQARDRMFLRMIIPHHELAIDMAEDALRNAEHQELKDLATEIIADQSAEIVEMEGYLRAWYGEDSTRDAVAGMRDMT